MSIGPKTTIRRSCADCEVCQGERYTCQGDSGTDVYCAHPSLPQRRIIGDTRWDTPPWCPAEPEIAARADAEIESWRLRAEQSEAALGAEDARIAELERECSQWRDELRIYRETENKRIAELVELLPECRDCVVSDINHTLAQFHEPASVDYLHALLMRVDAALARAGNGGEE